MVYLVIAGIILCAVIPTYYYVKLRGWNKKI